MTKSAVELDEKSFEKFIKEGKCAIDFFAGWCGPCQAMAPEFESAAKAMKGKVRFGKINVEDEPALATRFEVMSVPTIILFEDGKLIGKSSGWLNRDGIIMLATDSF